VRANTTLVVSCLWTPEVSSGIKSSPADEARMPASRLWLQNEVHIYPDCPTCNQGPNILEVGICILTSAVITAVERLHQAGAKPWSSSAGRGNTPFAPSYHQWDEHLESVRTLAQFLNCDAIKEQCARLVDHGASRCLQPFTRCSRLYHRV